MSSEHYRISCHACCRTVLLPPHDGATKCPHCGARLQLEWAGAHKDLKAERKADS